jgi:hypothetical protein
MTSERERILAKIYKAMAFDDELRGLFNRDWNYIYTIFDAGNEAEIPDAILEFIEGWMDTV